MSADRIPGARCPGGMLAEENFWMRRASGWNGRRHAECDVSGWNGNGGIPNAICVQVECWRRRNSGCDGRLGGMAAGGILDAMRPDGMNMVVSSMKDGYELYGHGGLGEWF